MHKTSELHRGIIVGNEMRNQVLIDFIQFYFASIVQTLYLLLFYISFNFLQYERVKNI